MISGSTAITIGNFDGVHLGHAALLRRCRTLAARVVVMAFDPHPAAVLSPGNEPSRLTSFDRRAELLRSLGADEVVRLDPADGTLSLTAAEFISRVVGRHKPAWFVEGPDFHFGKGRTGTIETLRELGAGHGFKVDVVDPIDAPMADGAIVRVSSTLIRWLVQHGRVNDAAALLGRPHEIAGTVTRGDRLGRVLGFPTANLTVAHGVMLPPDGVYAACAVMSGGERALAALSIGVRPTFAGHDRRIEAHLIALDGGKWTPPTLAPEYGWPLRLELVAWVRDQVRFAGREALVAQIERDCRRVVELLAHCEGDGGVCVPVETHA